MEKEHYVILFKVRWLKSSNEDAVFDVQRTWNTYTQKEFLYKTVKKAQLDLFQK